MRNSILVLSLFAAVALANEDAAGCSAGLFVKDPVTGKITQQQPKEESCNDKKEDIVDTVKDPLAAFMSEDEDDVSTD